jgi:hypothetical protein
MSKQTFEEVFAPVQERYRDEVLSETWGHLHPEDGKEYSGYLLFTHGAYGDTTIIRSQFEGLDDSPWLFDDLNGFVEQHIDANPNKEGTIWRWKGTYKRTLTPEAWDEVNDVRINEDEWAWEFTGRTTVVNIK